MHEMDVIAANQHRLHLGDEALPLIGAKPRHGRFSAREALEMTSRPEREGLAA